MQRQQAKGASRLAGHGHELAANFTHLGASRNERLGKRAQPIDVTGAHTHRKLLRVGWTALGLGGRGFSPSRPPLRVEDGLIEVGWAGDPADEEPADFDDSDEIDEFDPEEGEPVDDHYAALQAWAEWARNRDRLAHRAELVAQIGVLLAGAPRASWLEKLSAAGIPNGPMNTIAEVAAEAQTAAIGLMQNVPGEDFSLLGLPISFDGERPAIRAGAPRLGLSPGAQTS